MALERERFGDRNGKGHVSSGGEVGASGRTDRRAFSRLSITESIKIELVDGPPDSAATFGSTIDISRGGLEFIGFLGDRDGRRRFDAREAAGDDRHGK